MSGFLSNAVKLIKSKERKAENQQAVSDYQNLFQDFSFRNYVKESFSVLIVRPVSNYVMKFMRITSFVATGTAIGIGVSLLLLVFLLQFGSLENKFISLFVDNRISELFPDSDFSVKSSKLTWNSEKGMPEICLKKLKLDDIEIPNVSVFPDIIKSVQEHKFITDSIHIVNPKIHLRLSDDFKTIHFDPNFQHDIARRAISEPLSVLKGFQRLLNGFIDLKIIDADVTIEENGVIWNLQNAYCHHIVGDKMPHALSFKTRLQGQNYLSSVDIVRTKVDNIDKYVVNLEACNPYGIKEKLLKRRSPVNSPMINAILENNLPISGLVHLDSVNNKIVKGDFDLNGGAGIIKIPAKSVISLNLGKQIDNGNISGTFSESGIDIDSVCFNYESSKIQLTGINIPMVEYNLMDTANISGTLSLLNVSIPELTNLLPDNFSKSIMPTFKNYMPGFKLDLFRVDLAGAMAFNKKNYEIPMEVGNGTFKISEANLPLGENMLSDLSATGTIKDDGFEIKLHKAKFNDTVINSGEFFIDKKDNSWIGTINADVASDEVKNFASEISKQFGSLKLNNLSIAKTANVDMKLVKVEGDNMAQKSLPFRIVAGTGSLKSPDNTKTLKFSWDENELNVVGDVNAGTSSVTLSLEENLKNNEGATEIHCKSESDFIKGIVPEISKICSGDYSIDLNMGWQGDVTQCELYLNLKDAVLYLPILGDMKAKTADGSLSAKILRKDGMVYISDLQLNTTDNKISGSLVLDKEGSLYKCSLDEFLVNGNNVGISIVRDSGEKVSASFVGKRFDTEILNAFLKSSGKKEVISCYLNLDEVSVANETIKNVKGSLDIVNSKIVNGACYGVIGESTTLALSAKPDATNKNESLISLSASDAGEFLKYFRFIDGVKGGTLNFVVKSDLISSNSMSGAFEMKDFVVQNENLTRLLSFSSMNGIINSENYSVGFNSCLGSFVWSNDTIKIENGRLVGPTVGITYEGTYNRLEDRLSISGFSLMTSSIMASRDTNGTYGAPYTLIGTLGRSILSVKPLQFINDAPEKFGNLMPLIPELLNGPKANTNIAPHALPNEKYDVFANQAFDQQVAPKAKASKLQTRNVIENKFGATINRGKKAN